MPHPVFQQLRYKLNRVRGDDRAFRAQCPVCEDNRSLSVGHGDDGRVLMNCYAQCEFADILAAVGLKARDLFAGSSTGAVVVPVNREPSWREPPPAPNPKWLNIALEAYRQGADGIDPLATQLGVSRESLTDLRIGFLSADQVFEYGEGRQRRPAYTIPERNGLNQVVGVGLRFLDGSKGFLRGGNRGLVIPASIRGAMPSALYAVEGMSDCAAILSTGNPAVARASCSHGAADLYHLLREHPETVPIIVGDRDEPGCEGAKRVRDNLRFMLKRHVQVVLPPAGFKDMREALIGGAL